MKEVRRFLKVQTQTIWAPAITTLLFLVIFTVALRFGGRGGRDVLGVPFASFRRAGPDHDGHDAERLRQFVASRCSRARCMGTIIDYLMPPLSEGELMIGIVGAAVTRAVLVGSAVALAMLLWPGVAPDRPRIPGRSCGSG